MGPLDSARSRYKSNWRSACSGELHWIATTSSLIFRIPFRSSIAPLDSVVKLQYAGVRTLCRTRRRRLGEEDDRGALMTAMGSDRSRSPGAYIIARDEGKAAGRKIRGTLDSEWQLGGLNLYDRCCHGSNSGSNSPSYANRRSTWAYPVIV